MRRCPLSQGRAEPGLAVASPWLPDRVVSAAVRWDVCGLELGFADLPVTAAAPFPVQEIAEPLFDLKLGMEQLAKNQTFRCILATLLAMGNVLNGSQVRGRGRGLGSPAAASAELLGDEVAASRGLERDAKSPADGSSRAASAAVCPDLRLCVREQAMRAARNLAPRAKVPS